MLIQKSQNFIQYQEITFLCSNHFTGKSVIIIQFLKGNERRELDFLEELDQLDIKIFRFEKMETCYDQLNEEEQAEEERNILNGLNFARKVIPLIVKNNVTVCHRSKHSSQCRLRK